MKSIATETLTWTYAHDPKMISGTWTAQLPAPVQCEYGVATAIEAWRDTQMPGGALWTVFTVNAEGHQMSPAQYGVDRAEAFAEGEYLAGLYANVERAIAADDDWAIA